jgi:hypothetical protein
MVVLWVALCTGGRVMNLLMDQAQYHQVSVRRNSHPPFAQVVQVAVMSVGKGMKENSKTKCKVKNDR